MCGIVGYVGSGGPSARAGGVVMGGLERLEYRGYDSAGLAVVTSDRERLAVAKKAGKLTNLAKELAQHPLSDGTAAIGHTRWATHGPPTDANAHPHLAADGRIAIIHNGIIENYGVLRAELLAQGVTFHSDTDTEVAGHLFARYVDEGLGLADAMRAVARRLEGAFTLLAVDAASPDVVVGTRRNSPLVAGLGEGENFLGSDVVAFIEHTRMALELGQDEIVEITPTAIHVTDLAGNPVEREPYEVTWDASAAQKGGFATFMDKEIHDQPAAVADTLRGRVNESGRLQLDEGMIAESVLAAIDKIIVIACGTAAYSGMVARYAIEHWTRIPVEVELAHEFRYRDPVLSVRTLVVAVSQSGETMDTIMALRHAQQQGAPVVAIVNVQGSTIAREADAVLYTRAGPEIAVASTKAFLAQIAAAYLLGIYLAELRGNKFPDEIASLLAELDAMPAKIQRVLDTAEPLREIARSMVDERTVLFLGRHVGYPVALEGALKLKELAYIHAEGFAAGELKHGPIALIEPGQPVFIVLPSPRGREVLHSKVISNIQEVRARGARTVVIAEEGDIAAAEHADYLITVPETPTLLMPLVTVVPLQIFAHELASAKGFDVDQPRNLAKSVTVE
ncbi:glutamine--fructose-6-phosphate transaminase (isomerizing) [Demequina sp. TTPB684]|uniref:glutamine--fructose-6-phosphate transaminase (isomerizing) n=1 Tax=unclassified Demequina TaxID=2620311 RepID=UPI001CF2C219|nr:MULTISPECIES: glutamine--fructose-6-phosphate transaminase (isomerizing) [unclassified Demequina]MCB2412937.1 glutamine--fructose-6-phosphate transaminase (isomerizing) [Demequina sp. TTPB684]UPU88436.1 glutamine--fructose-6-phosphate transaminase (isomerizing) [Demequina sp. TMPB413]